ncbi:hypothetical protein N7540_010994 [Penicillium herquei]|nr:hypothetical protein N7540_010994 [Penicillium herquei]
MPPPSLPVERKLMLPRPEKLVQALASQQWREESTQDRVATERNDDGADMSGQERHIIRLKNEIALWMNQALWNNTEIAKLRHENERLLVENARLRDKKPDDQNCV